MTATTLFTPKVRKGIIHFIVFLIAITFIFSQYKLDYFNEILIWQPLAIGLLGLLAFYLHALILLPILLRKKQIKRYLLYLLIALISFHLAYNWFEASYSSIITHYSDGSKPSPFDFFLSPQWMINSFFTKVLVFVPFALVSFIYYLLIISQEDRKGIFSLKYLELTVNIIIVGSILLLVKLNVNIESVEIVNYLFLTVYFISFYVNTFVTIPILIKQKQIGKYLFFSGMSFLIFIYGLKGLLLLANIDLQPFPGFFALSFVFLIIYVLSFIYGYLRIKIIAKEQILNLKLGAKNSELKLLKSQVNPHFLFNTLNTLYATALEENASKTAESTAKLANLIRYMQEDIDKDFTPLENEIKYLQDYIAIQKLRCAVEPKIETKFENIAEKVISPGLLIPFVENAFKYGIDPSKASKLFVSVVCDENNTYFECINSFDNEFKTYYKEQGFGIGINNAKQRLELVYPNKHSFELEKENNIFSVKICIKTKV